MYKQSFIHLENNTLQTQDQSWSQMGIQHILLTEDYSNQ